MDVSMLKCVAYISIVSQYWSLLEYNMKNLLYIIQAAHVQAYRWKCGNWRSSASVNACMCVNVNFYNLDISRERSLNNKDQYLPCNKL